MRRDRRSEAGNDGVRKVGDEWGQTRYAGKRIVLGVSGSIASYKAADIASKLMQAGGLVDVVLTQAAQEFITPLTFRSLTHRLVITDLFDANSEDPLEHVEIARQADAIVIAPATANVMAKLTHGLADDALSTIVLATEAPVLIAPAMEHHMWQTLATRQTFRRWKEQGLWNLPVPMRADLLRRGWARGRSSRLRIFSKRSRAFSPLIRTSQGDTSSSRQGAHRSRLIPFVW